MQLVPLEIYQIIGKYLDIVSASRLSRVNKHWQHWWQMCIAENEDHQDTIHFLEFTKQIQITPLKLLMKVDNPQLTYWYLTKQHLVHECEATQLLTKGYIAEGCLRSLQAVLSWTQQKISWLDLVPAADHGQFDLLLYYCRQWGTPHDMIFKTLVYHKVDDVRDFLEHLQPQPHPAHFKLMRQTAAQKARLPLYVWLCEKMPAHPDLDNDLDLALMDQNMPVVEYCHGLGLTSKHPRKTIKQCIAAGYEDSVIFMILQGWNLEGTTLMAMKHHKFHLLEVLHAFGGQPYTSQLLTLALAQNSLDALKWCLEHSIAFSARHFHMLFQHDFVEGVQYLYECGVIMVSQDWCKHILTWNAKKIGAWCHDIQ